jgi:dihydropteroate synthase
VCARAGAGVVLMHSRGGVGEMASYTHAEYGDVTADVRDELKASVRAAEAAGIAREAICIDPGLGFSKRSAHSIRVLAELPRLVACGLPVLVGASRKRFIGELIDARPGAHGGMTASAERDAGTIGANVAALGLGARLFRVHDVRSARQALDVAWAVMSVGRNNA